MFPLPRVKTKINEWSDLLGAESPECSPLEWSEELEKWNKGCIFSRDKFKG